jgi:tetratricopeptide (TPR) repeat protein
LNQAVWLADEAIRAGNAEGYLVKALALAAQRRWTDAVLEYSQGLEKLSGSAEQARVLRYLMENHPSLRVPDGQRPPDGQSAERYFDLGLRYYWDRQYPQAEKEFARAVRSNDGDARLLYFLGLAQLGMERRDQAAESFRKAAELERQGKPQAVLISGALERVQGPQRQVLNRYRP